MRQKTDDFEDYGRKESDERNSKERNDVMKISCLLSEAQQFMRQDRPIDAEVFYNELLLMQPNNIHILLLRARCRLMSEKFAESVSDADSVLKLDPSNAAAVLAKANAFFARGDFEDAMMWFCRTSLFFKI